MKKNKWLTRNKLKIVLPLSIIIVILLAVFCCVCASHWNANVVSMLSGWLSAFATVVVGLIALYQNKRYKELSDKLDIRQNAPEFFVQTPIADPEKFGTQIRNAVVAHGTKSGGLQTDRLAEFWFTSMDKPVLHLRPKYVVIGEKKEILSMEGASEINTYRPYSPFCIRLADIDCDYSGKQKFEMVCEYENIYGVSYKKTYFADITISGKTIKNRSWGKLSIAERIETYE